MGYQVLARKYRPQKFADVAGQEHVTRTLTNALTQGRIAHGYIFSGHRGIGKTTIARIVAQALNCRAAIGSPERAGAEPCGICDSCIEIRQGNAVDVIEIDAATNRGIDEIRELRDAARYSPARDKYKIYILDEAHQITDAAFNALLKTLEEPPAHVIFMMATTEPENIPQTIRSRCQHFSFHAVKFDDILAQLRMIAIQENVVAEDGALALLAEAGDGSMRDALSIMDQAIASSPLTAGRPTLQAEQIRELMGAVPNAVFEKLLESVSAGQSAALMEHLNQLLNAGHSPQALTRQMVRYLRNCLMAKLGGEQTELLQISLDERARAARSALLFSEEELTRNLNILLRTFDDLSHRQEQRFHLELGLMKLVHAQRLLPLEDLLSGLASGAPSGAAGAQSGRGPVSGPVSGPVPSQAQVGGRGGSPSPTSSASPSPRPSPSPAAPSTPATHRSPAAPDLSPFAPGPNRGPVAEQPAAQPVSRSPIALVAGLPPVPAPAADAYAGLASDSPSENRTQGALAIATPWRESRQESRPDPNPGPGSADLDSLRRAVVDALAAAGHASASVLLEDGQWTLDGNNLRIEVAAKKTMLSLTVNAAAEKLIRAALTQAGGPPRFLIVPGEGLTATSSAGGSGRGQQPAAVGSIQAEALADPLVKRAQELFQAEVRAVVDLRDKG